MRWNSSLKTICILGSGYISTMPGIMSCFSALRCSLTSMSTVLRCSKIKSFYLGLAKCKQALIISIILLFSVTAVMAGENTIKVGMTTVLSGPSQTLGHDFTRGIQTYFNKINEAGGLHGKKLELIILDDQYEPVLAAPNMRHLIDKDNVIAIIGNVGTPTAVVSVPIANEKKTLLFGMLSGADLLRKTPPDRYVINFRASYEEEIAEMIKNLLSKGIKPDELAFFIQNDAYGYSGYQGIIKALKAVGYAKPESLPYGSYVRNTINVEDGLAQIMATAKKPPKAIMIIGIYQPTAKFIKLAKKEFPNTLFLNVSFVGATALAHTLGKESDHIIVTQVVPFFNTNLPAVQEYHRDIKKYFPKQIPGFLSLEGYLMAKLFVLGLEKAEINNKLTREGIIDAFESMRDVDIGIGEKINFDNHHHQALHTVWPTILKKGKVEPLDWSTVKSDKYR